MFGRLRSPLRHPFYPNLLPTQAAEANGEHAALAGSFEELAGAAGRGVQVTDAVFLLQNEPEAAGDDRLDALWNWFQVPSFVLVLDSHGRPAAYECEAREGLHVTAPMLSAEYAKDLCRCGRPGPRLRVQSTESSRGATTLVRQYS